MSSPSPESGLGPQSTGWFSLRPGPRGSPGLAHGLAQFSISGETNPTRRPVLTRPGAEPGTVGTWQTPKNIISPRGPASTCTDYHLIFIFQLWIHLGRQINSGLSTRGSRPGRGRTVQRVNGTPNKLDYFTSTLTKYTKHKPSQSSVYKHNTNAEK